MTFILKEVRKSKKTTQKQLSQKTGLSVSYIQKLETGNRQNPSYIVVKKLAAALNSSVEELFLSDDE